MKMEFQNKLFLVILVSFLLAIILVYSLGEKPVKYIKQTIDIGWRVVTAYNPVKYQTDNRPCEGAMSGINFCKTNQRIVATNELPLGSKVIINDKEYLVADRTNSRYRSRYDILMMSYVEAMEFGRKTLLVYKVK